MEELTYNKQGKLVNALRVSNNSVVLNGVVIADKTIKKDGIKYNFLGSYPTSNEAKELIKRRRNVFGNQYLHQTMYAGGLYLVYIGSNPKFRRY